MSITLRRIQKYKKAKSILEELHDNPQHVLIIHYSCESFYDIKEGRTPRITSIAIRYLRSAQTKSFSIHKVAEIQNLTLAEIEAHYNTLEKQMLTEYFDFLKEHKDYKWVHWNMRDINYGFEALENRFIVLGGQPFQLNDDNKIDMARVLIDKYGNQYIGHPRLTQLIEKNDISAKNLLSGDAEAKAFDNKEYVKLHQSTLRKVDVMDSILKRTAEGDLKTNATMRQIYGLTPQGIYELIKDHWLWSLIISIIMLFLGWLLS
ncbi:hypothetical protein [Foetidibacter luteolus]|uniref:hypothetical protein n=1 Tax=Foetidibacter luteolus TaxID=2608880 RepID=UPI00129B4DC4|nr:hypothetical protein [Foetidibacter luteolus]